MPVTTRNYESKIAPGETLTLDIAEDGWFYFTYEDLDRNKSCSTNYAIAALRYLQNEVPDFQEKETPVNYILDYINERKNKRT